MKLIIIKSIEQLDKGMEVELKHRHWENKISGCVSEVKCAVKGRTIGHKPVSKRTVQSVSVLCEDGEEISITPNDFTNFQIRRI